MHIQHKNIIMEIVNNKNNKYAKNKNFKAVKVVIDKKTIEKVEDGEYWYGDALEMDNIIICFPKKIYEQPYMENKTIYQKIRYIDGSEKVVKYNTNIKSEYKYWSGGINEIKKAKAVADANGVDIWFKIEENVFIEYIGFTEKEKSFVESLNVDNEWVYMDNYKYHQKMINSNFFKYYIENDSFKIDIDKKINSIKEQHDKEFSERTSNITIPEKPNITVKYEEIVGCGSIKYPVYEVQEGVFINFTEKNDYKPSNPYTIKTKSKTIRDEDSIGFYSGDDYDVISYIEVDIDIDNDTQDIIEKFSNWIYNYEATEKIEMELFKKYKEIKDNGAYGEKMERSGTIAHFSDYFFNKIPENASKVGKMSNVDIVKEYIKNNNITMEKN